MTPETTVADVHSDVRTVTLTLAGAPDEKQKRDGRPFVVEHGRVIDAAPDALDPDQGKRRVYIIITGRSIRADGTIGKAKRWRAYNLSNANWLEPAPAWIRDTLRAAGVTW